MGGGLRARRAAAYEFVLAFAGGVGAQSGYGSPGEDYVAVVALVTILAGAVLAGIAAGGGAAFLVAPAAAAFVTARFYTYDPYYAPSLRRYSDGGLVAPWWILALLGLALAAGIATRRRPRSGAGAASILVLLLLLATGLVTGAGH